MLIQGKKYIFLITEKFPYHNRETFLETEIMYLSECFDEIFIIPSSADVLDKQYIRILPNNVHVIGLNFEKAQFNLYKIASAVLTKTFFYEFLFLVFNTGAKSFLTKIKTALASLISAKDLSAKIIDFCLYKNIKINKNTKFYSYWWDNTAVTCALIKKRFGQAIIVSRAHGADVYFYRNRMNYLPYKQFMLRHFDIISFISNDGKDYIENKFGRISNLFVFKLGINKSDSNIHTQPPNNEILKIVTCSSVIKLKRVDLLIDALKEIDDFTIYWNHYGDGPLFNLLKMKAEKFLINKDNIHYFLPGRINNNEITKLYCQNKPDLFVNLSEYEGIPVTIMEAFACGIPAIATNVGGVSEIVNENCGFLLNKDCTPKKVADTIVQFINLTVDKKLEMRKAAYKMWDENYNAEKNYPEFISKIQSL